MAAPQMDILYRGDGLLEAPRWDGANALYYTNVTLGGVHRLDLRDLSTDCVVPHRRGIGGLALTEETDFIVAGRNVALKRAGHDETAVLLDPGEEDHAIVGFNDMAVDDDGAVVVGALGPGAINPKTLTGNEAPPAEGSGTGSIYRIDPRGHREVARDIGHPNGIGFSPDRQFAYVSDTLRRIVYRFRVGPDGWSERETFFSPDDGMPDGLAVAADGSIFVAIALGTEIAVLDERGMKQEAYRAAVPLVTSLTFAGPDMRTVYVTTGSHGTQGEATIATFRSPVAGSIVPRAACLRRETA